jgi:hypothetical protein
VVRGRGRPVLSGRRYPVVVLGGWGLSRPHRAVLGKARITRNRLGQITDQAMRDLLDFAPIASRLFGNQCLQLLKPNKLEPAPSGCVGMGIGRAKTSL